MDYDKILSVPCPITNKPAMAKLVEHNASTMQDDLVFVRVDALGIVYAIEIDDFKYINSLHVDLKKDLIDFINSKHRIMDFNDVITITHVFEPYIEIQPEEDADTNA